IRVASGKCRPLLVDAETRHALVDQEKVRPGDRLVVAVRVAMGTGKAPESPEKVSKGLQQGLAPEVQPREADMILMMKFLVRERARFEALDELSIVHDGLPRSRRPGAAPVGLRWDRTTATAAA